MQLIDEKLMELLHTQNRDVSSDKTCDYTVNVLRCNSASCRLATGGTEMYVLVHVLTQDGPIVSFQPLWEGDTKGGSPG